MDNMNGNCNDANKTEPSGSEKESNIVHDDINFANKKARVNKIFSAPSYSIQIRDVAPMRDDEECSYHTYSKTNYPMGPKGKGIMEEVPKDENYEIDNQSLNIFLRMTIATIKSLDFSQGSWEYKIVLWAIRKHLLEEHIGFSLDSTLATQDDDGRHIGRTWACHCIKQLDEKGKKGVTNLVMRIWDQYKMKFFLQDRLMRGMETQYTDYRCLLSSSSQSSSTDEDERSSTDEDEVTYSHYASLFEAL